MRILKEDCSLVIVDVQERLYPHMFEAEHLSNNILKLIKGVKALDIPILLTQQYTKGLGDSLEEIKEELGTTEHIEKMSFSCCDDEGFANQLSKLGSKHVILCGIETHICVLQTALDLVEKNITPVVVADCVSSRRKYDKKIALNRISAMGGIVTTYESILLELARISGTATFKTISKIIK